MALTDSLHNISSIVGSMIPDMDETAAQQWVKELLSTQNFDLEAFQNDLNAHGENWGYQPRHDLPSSLMKAFIMKLTGVQPILGLDYAKEAMEKAKAGERVVMVGNHLSYGDTNYLCAQLELQGLDPFPLLVMAGPKVYQDLFRRLSSMCFETLKMAQPPSRASGGAEVSMRDLAEITRKVMKDAEAYQAKGRILYFFPEGSRTRSGAMEAFIPASARYCDQDNTSVYPVGFAGTDGLVGVESNAIHVEKPRVSIGAPLSMSQVSQELPEAPAERRKAWMDLLGFAVAAELPEALRGAYGDLAVREGQVQDWRHLLKNR